MAHWGFLQLTRYGECGGGQHGCGWCYRANKGLVRVCNSKLSTLGTFLTNQLPIQRLTAAYFVLSDLLILGQIIYYGNRANPTKDEINDNSAEAADSTNTYITSTATTPSERSPLLGSTSSKPQLLAIAAICVIAYILPPAHASITANDPRLCDAPIQVAPIFQILGSIAGWFSGCLYLFSRIPQVIMNYRHKSVEGLSVALFAITSVGNVAYGLQICMRFVTQILLLQGCLCWTDD